jgi:hypothetical protein
MTIAFFAVWGSAAGAVLLSWVYFGRWRLARPPIGVFTAVDLVFTVAAIVALPYLYLAFPSWLSSFLFGLGLVSVLYLVAEPILPGPRTRWLVVLALLGMDIGTATAVGPSSAWFRAVNDIVLVLGVVGAANLWAQEGMKARHLAALAAFLTVYDFVATVSLPLMNEVLARMATQPLAPELAWASVGDVSLRLGLGDVLVAALAPLVMRKAFGDAAGLTALGLMIGALGVMLAPPIATMLGNAFPAMIVLAPVMLVEWAFCVHRHGDEQAHRPGTPPARSVAPA